MIKILAVALLVAGISICGSAQADWKEDLEILKAEMKPCAIYSVKENQAGYATSLQLIGFRGLELDGIHSPDRNLLAVGLGYEVTSLEKLGVEVPLSKFFVLTVGGFYGVRDFTSEERDTDYGAFATIIKAF